ncbi:MAG: NUDIX domain-containing protein [Erysipelotrichaceae bacterium]|nr:NUDIX domain-containing protein [Erysipelotrichaceae bacterium]
MRLLFTIDLANYDSDDQVTIRNSARSIIIKDNRLAMVYSQRYDYYKFPGGGIEKGEDPLWAMVRETKEEAGLLVDISSIKPYGYVHRIEKSRFGGIFIQDNFYYLCQVQPKRVLQALDAYEQEEGFTLVYVDGKKVIDINRHHDHQDVDQTMLERECKVIEILYQEGYIR